jgi:hypothetical protein
MQLDVHIQRRHYRVHLVDARIFGIEQRIAEIRGQRGPTLYWRPLWRIGRTLRTTLLPVLEDARRQLLPKLRLATAADLDDIRQFVVCGRTAAPAWVWPDYTPPAPQQRRPQVQDWRKRREPGGWPPRPMAER